jgi:hypothetical protein
MIAIAFIANILATMLTLLALAAAFASKVISGSRKEVTAGKIVLSNQE